jgi:malonyl CoA-acyl carrier protein transacylase
MDNALLTIASKLSNAAWLLTHNLDANRLDAAITTIQAARSMAIAACTGAGELRAAYEGERTKREALQRALNMTAQRDPELVEEVLSVCPGAQVTVPTK